FGPDSGTGPGTLGHPDTGDHGPWRCRPGCGEACPEEAWWFLPIVVERGGGGGGGGGGAPPPARGGRGGRGEPLHGRVAVVVDDGIATGSTARAACQIARAHGAARVVLAVPVA